jgi:hypothetical protein
MRDLEHLEHWLQTVIMHQGGVRAGVSSPEARQLIGVAPWEVEKVVTRSRALTGLERLEIYHNAYYARLLECLREEFPAFARAVGEEAFNNFCVDYLQKYPSRSYTLNLLAANFPRYLAESRPELDEGDTTGGGWADFLIDLATLELTYGEVFDGPGVEGHRLLDVERLQGISPERWPQARLVSVPCLRLLALRYPVHRYARAVRQEKKPKFPRRRSTWLAVTRRNYVVRRYELTRLQHRLLEPLVAGKSVGEAVRLTAEAAGGGRERLAADLQLWFRNWTAEGFFQDVEFPGE